jgi:glucokinase
MSELRVDQEYIIGIDIGGTKLAVVISDREGNIIKKVRRPSLAQRGPEPMVADLIDMVREVMKETGVKAESIIGVGVSCGGPLDSEKGIIYEPPNLPGWDGVPLKQMLESALGIPALVENDANAGALAEYMFGAGRGTRNMIYMTMSTGVGGGIIADGRLIRGATDTAGEVGHMTIVIDGLPCGCGKRGCLEAYASGPSIARRMREALKDVYNNIMLDMVNGDRSKLSSEILLEAVKSGDELAIRLLNETAFYMGLGIANLVNILNPEVVTIGTIAIKAGDLLMEPLRETVKKESMKIPGNKVKVVPSALGDMIGDMAALAIILHKMNQGE